MSKLDVFVDSLIKAAEEGYETEGVDTIFGEKPGMGTPPSQMMQQGQPMGQQPQQAPAKKQKPKKEKKDKEKPGKGDSCSVDKKAGFLDFLQNQAIAYHAMKARETGVGQALVAPDLFEKRVTSGATTGLLAGILGAIIGGLAGGGIGTAVGDPLLLAILGAMAGSSLGFTAGNAAGQTKADKLYLADKGISAKIPVPVRPIALPFTVGAALPVGTHAKYETVKG